MANIFRLLLGVLLLPACWGASRSLLDALVLAAGERVWMNVQALSLAGGMLAFFLCWMLLSHPVRAYVLGHELTHALWGVFFGARPSDLRVSEAGGSVRLTKTNMFITLAPYFFPFYTFVVILSALVTYAFLRPLPYLSLWLFLIGFTWAFHVLFTLETLTQRQPDVRLYGRIFSWTFILLVNVAIVLLWLVAMTPLTFADLVASLGHRLGSAYAGTGWAIWKGLGWFWGLFETKKGG